MLGRSSDVRLEAAWRTLQQLQSFEVWRRDMDEAWYMDMIPEALRPTERSTEGAYGVARLPNGDRAACTGASLTLDRDHGYDEPHDELVLCVREYSPPESTPLEVIYAWLADIGRFVFSGVPYEWAMIGDELDDVDDLQPMDRLVNSERRFGLLVPSDDGVHELTLSQQASNFKLLPEPNQSTATFCRTSTGSPDSIQSVAKECQI